MKANEPGAVLFDPFTGKPATLSDNPGEGYYHIDVWRRETATDMGKKPWLFNPFTGKPRTQYAVTVDPYFELPRARDMAEAVDHGRRILSDEESKASISRYKSLTMGSLLKDPDPVSNPAHYTAHPSGVECIQITEHMGFNLGNAVKYIWRADLKGNGDEDLAKAAWYIQREIERRRTTK